MFPENLSSFIDEAREYYPKAKLTTREYKNNLFFFSYLIGNRLKSKQMCHSIVQLRLIYTFTLSAIVCA